MCYWKIWFVFCERRFVIFTDNGHAFASQPVSYSKESRLPSKHLWAFLAHKLLTFWLIGLFHLFTAMNIAHRLCSGSFKRLATSICYVTMAVGHLIALVMISLGWYPESNYFASSSVRTYFFSLAGLMGINIIVMAVVIYRMIDIPVRLGTDWWHFSMAYIFLKEFLWNISVQCQWECLECWWNLYID